MTKKEDNRGRPEIPEKDRRSVVVQFRCTNAEKKQLDKIAKAKGVKLSDWIREQLIS